MQTDVLCHVAVSSATYAIDKPYTYLVPESLEQRIQPGMRVIVPFGTGNRRVEGLILNLFSGERKRGLKPVRALLDETPVLDPSAIKLALWMRERYFCTVYDAVKAMLPAGLYFSLKDRYSIVIGDRAGDSLCRLRPANGSACAGYDLRQRRYDGKRCFADCFRRVRSDARSARIDGTGDSDPGNLR